MKEETREIINDIKDALRTTMNSVRYRRAVDFLDSLPEIESHLCHGGYIQDKNGAPCCQGDEVLFFVNKKESKGDLIWSSAGYFYITTGILSYDTREVNWFEKVEE